jgi:hypothetical protein
MAEETPEIRADIAETRAELADAVEDLAEKLGPRRQAQRLVRTQREAALRRLRELSSTDAGALVLRVRDEARARPAAAAGVGAGALLLLLRRGRRR